MAVDVAKSRPDLLLILRGLAAWAVVCWHVVGYKGELPPLVNVPGRTAVWLFFGISGYVIAYGFVHQRYSVTRAGMTAFWTNRFLRIYPLFFVLSVLSWVTASWVAGSSVLALRDVPAQFLAWQFNQNYALSGVFWTLGIELHFYFIAPVLALPLLARTRYAVPMGILLFVVAACAGEYLVIHAGWSRDGRNIVANLQHFLAGMLACRVVARWRPTVPVAWLAGAGAVSLLALTNWYYHRLVSNYWSAGGMLLIDAAIALFVVAHAGCERLTVPGRQPVYGAMIWLGTLSYGLYAWHGYFLANFPSTSGSLFGLTLISLAGAFATYQLVERPSQRWRRRTDRQRSE